MRILYTIQTTTILKGIAAYAKQKMLHAIAVQLDQYDLDMSHIKTPQIAIVEMSDYDMAFFIQLKEIKHVINKTHLVVLVPYGMPNYYHEKLKSIGVSYSFSKPQSMRKTKEMMDTLMNKLNMLEDLIYKDIWMDQQEHKIYIKNNPMEITTKEYDVLRYFLYNPAIEQRKEDIFYAIWDTKYIGASRTLDMHIKTIRRKLEAMLSDVKIYTIRKQGYKLL